MTNTSKYSRTQNVNIESAKRLIGLKISAYRDYISARILYLENQLHHASILANTCIEKELKACLYALGDDYGKQHDSLKLFNLLLRHDDNLSSVLNKQFIKNLSKIYESRYYEKLQPGYNFVIVKRKYLAELDFTYATLEGKVKYVKASEIQIPKSIFDCEVENKSEAIVRDNYLLAGESKENYLSKPDLVQEFRIAHNHEVLESTYSIPTNTDLTKFDYTALVPSSDNISFKVSHNLTGLEGIEVLRNGIVQKMKPLRK